MSAMNLAPEPISHCSRAHVRSGAADSGHGEPFGPVIVLTQLLVLDFCVVRTAADFMRGSMSIEGGVALALAVILAASLVRRLVLSRSRIA
jgi:hypothetical protein